MSLRGLAAMAGASVVLAACTTTPATAVRHARPSPSRLAASSPRPSPSSSPSPTPRHAGIIVVYQPLTEETFTAAERFEAIHEATIVNGTVTDRVVSANPGGELTAASDLFAFVVAPRPGEQNWISNGPQPEAIQLSFGITRRFDPGPAATTCVLPSPDQSEILVCSFDSGGEGRQKLQILDLHSGAVAGLGPGFTPPNNPIPIAWTNRGMLIGGCPQSPCGNQNAYLFDPSSSTVTWVTDFNVVAASPSGDYMGEVDDGHPQYGRCNDSIHVVHYQGPAQPSTTHLIATQPGKELKIVAVGDDGAVLYAEGDCVNPHGGPGPSPLPNLYYYSAGTSTLQRGLTLDFAGPDVEATNSHGTLLGGATGVVVQSNVSTSQYEIDVVVLCVTNACHPKTTTITKAGLPVIDYAFSVLP